MYVEKFVGETLDETLRLVKEKLGPDAIIIKTVSNKGLKGALKKHKVEITAAISERNYLKKAKVDSVLNNDQKDKFYKGRATDIAESINRYDDNAAEERPTDSAGGYGKLALNRVVNSTRKTTEKIKSGLDDFLSSGFDDGADEEEAVEERPAPARPESPAPRRVAPAQETHSPAESSEWRFELQAYKNKIELLEHKLQSLASVVQKQKEGAEEKELPSIHELRCLLKSLELTDAFVGKLVRKLIFELSESELQNADSVFEFALREIASSVETEMPLFSTTDSDGGPVITVLLSETSCGQSTMAVKLAALKKDSLIIVHGDQGQTVKRHDMALKLFQLDVAASLSIAEIYSTCRKAYENNKSVFVDFRPSQGKADETKSFVDGLRRSFKNVEVLVCLSAIHSETYNRKIISKYKDFANGTIISHVDLCLNYGALLNVHHVSNGLPLKFFGTGATVPDDVEAASAERIIAGMFKF